MKHLRALTVAAALPALLLAACNKPGETANPLGNGASAPAASEPAAPAASAASTPAGDASAASGAGSVGGSGTGSAAPLGLAASSPVVATDAQRQAGAKIASQGAGNGVAACASCHGAQGQGNAASGFPRIAGQSYAYLLRQLDSSASGARQNPVMGPIAKALGAEQRADVAAYYASLPPDGGAAAQGGAASGNAKAMRTNAASGNDRGRRLALAGDESKFVQACVNCHGPGGSGEGSVYPYIGGQHESYLVNALQEWRNGTRNTDPSGQMPLVAKSLSEADAKAVAAYYAAQPLPTHPRDADASALPAVAASAPAAGASSVTSGPRGGSEGLQGNGTEQGAPTTGGSQGPGGGGGGSGSGSSGSPTGVGQTGTGSAHGSAASGVQ
jgi:cytochrome c553